MHYFEEKVIIEIEITSFRILEVEVTEGLVYVCQIQFLFVISNINCIDPYIFLMTSSFNVQDPLPYVTTGSVHW